MRRLAQRFLDDLRIVGALDIGAEDRVDDRRVKLAVVVFDEHLEALQHRREYPGAAAMLPCLMMLEEMHDDRAPPRGLARNSIPMHALRRGPPIALMRAPNVVGDRRAVLVDLDAAAQRL